MRMFFDVHVLYAQYPKHNKGELTKCNLKKKQLTLIVPCFVVAQ